MNATERLERTKQFALRVVKLIEALRRSVQGRAIASQLMSSGNSVAANYGAACRARSRLEFFAKLGTIEEEADESAFWLELIIHGKLLSQRQVAPLLNEAKELVAIAPVSKKTSRRLSQLQIADRKSPIS